MEENKYEKDQERETQTGGEYEPLEALTAHFRRTSRGRIVPLPRWAQ